MRFWNKGVLVSLALVLAACTVQPAPATEPNITSIPTIAVPTATPGPTLATYQVQRGEVVDMLQLSGRVAAAVDQDVFFTRKGYISQLYVKRNDQVTSGQVLAELDPGDLTEQIDRAKAELATIEQAEATIRQQRQYAIASARISLRNAQDNLARLQAPPSEAEIQSAREEIERARIDLEQTRDSTSAAKTRAEFAVRQAANNVRDAQDAYSKVVWENGNRPSEDLNSEQRARQEKAARAIEEAQANLTLAQISYDLAVQNEINAIELGQKAVAEAERKLNELMAPPDPFDLAAARRGVEAAQISLNQIIANSASPETAARIKAAKQAIAELQEQIDTSKIYAPFDGIVAEVGVKPGDLIDAYAPVINVIDPTRLTLVVAEISSSDLARIAPGQQLDIVFDRYPGQSMPGVVEHLPSDQISAGSQVRADRLLRISFAAGERSLTVGDPGIATIVFKREPDALWLPPQAIYRFDERPQVLLQEGTQQRQVDIVIGIRMPERVQILSGLKEGDTVVVADTLTR